MHVEHKHVALSLYEGRILRNKMGLWHRVWKGGVLKQQDLHWSYRAMYLFFSSEYNLHLSAAKQKSKDIKAWLQMVPDPLTYNLIVERAFSSLVRKTSPDYMTLKVIGCSDCALHGDTCLTLTV